MTKLGWIALSLLTALGCGGEASSGDQGAGAAAGAGASGSGGSGADGGSGGDASSCSQVDSCALGVCVFSQGSCDPSSVGSCQVGFTCDGPPTGPLCQCDGTVLEGMYAVCDKWGQGQPYDDPEPCASGSFACGALSCTRHVEVCVVTYPGMPGPEEYACVPVSDIAGSCAHGIADCSCLDLSSVYCDSGAACDCVSDADGQETVTVALP